MNIPNHVAIIMDGNGRWAKKRGLSRSAGHKEGSKTLKLIANHAFSKGVKILSVFAFSTENFKRDSEEVDYLMDLIYISLRKLTKELKEKNIRIVFSKKDKGLPEKLEKLIQKLEKETINNQAGIFNICINYGSYDEVLDMTKKIASMVKDNKLSINDINKDIIFNNLYVPLPNIDLLIRTSGEYRLSNFMLLQLAYSELYFTDTYFPDFDTDEFDKALIEFNQRDRRFGNVKK